MQAARSRDSTTRKSALRLANRTHLVRKRNPRLGNKALRRIHEMAQGWVAGITLMLEREKFPGLETGAEADFSYEGVFNYFAGEIFDDMDQDTRVFLLQTALLSQLNVSLANKLTGGDSAQRILSTLHSHHLFTEKLSGSGQNYRYHPLLKEFLHQQGIIGLFIYGSDSASGARPRNFCRRPG